MKRSLKIIKSARCLSPAKENEHMFVCLWCDYAARQKRTSRRHRCLHLLPAVDCSAAAAESSRHRPRLKVWLSVMWLHVLIVVYMLHINMTYLCGPTLNTLLYIPGPSHLACFTSRPIDFTLFHLINESRNIFLWHKLSNFQRNNHAIIARWLFSKPVGTWSVDPVSEDWSLAQ